MREREREKKREKTYANFQTENGRILLEQLINKAVIIESKLLTDVVTIQSFVEGRLSSKTAPCLTMRDTTDLIDDVACLSMVVA